MYIKTLKEALVMVWCVTGFAVVMVGLGSSVSQDTKTSSFLFFVGQAVAYTLLIGIIYWKTRGMGSPYD